MGQYYRVIFLDETGKTILNSWCPFIAGCGSKLMEHAAVGNQFVAIIEHLLLHTPTRVVWAGDYADKEPESDKNLYRRSTIEESDRKVLITFLLFMSRASPPYWAAVV